ncbi:fas apoptotic inhibitory molecule 3 isoform X1 [Trichechus manatus latirostris]|uniref:Fas apoptotic inhibitory molecule 3 isoform X1 n=1 Tax=Trichechus manatus latirostris TaxID=127582 RepID=A0A2Y9QXV1_TRIMA|nr:fas apoptotic inhibitory molecule 3 isoform X1 [Trichechus manatus latirostris]
MFPDRFCCKPVPRAGQGWRSSASLPVLLAPFQTLLLFESSVSGALKILPAVNLEGELGGSVTFECPLPKTYSRIYLCREMAAPGVCATVVSNGNFAKKEYIGRVSLNVCRKKNLFLVEMTGMTEDDSGVYACGVGLNTDRGKTQQITLSISKYYPFWEEEMALQTPGWFHRLLYLTAASTAPWFQMPEDAIPSEFVFKVTPAPRTQAPPADHPLPATPITHHSPISRASSVAAGKPPTLLPATTASKTSAREEEVRPQPAGYNHQTRLHRERAFNHGLSGAEDQDFHILIPTILGLMLLALLGMVVKRAIQRRKVLSRRVRRLAVRMRALEASQRPRLSQRPRMSQRPRSQNIYSACPRRARGADAAGPEQAPLPGPGATEPSAPPQVSEAPWFHAPSLKTSCEYVSCYHQPPAKTEDYDSDDYINVPRLAHLPSYPPRPRPLCQ